MVINTNTLQRGRRRKDKRERGCACDTGVSCPYVVCGLIVLYIHFTEIRFMDYGSLVATLRSKTFRDLNFHSLRRS